MSSKHSPPLILVADDQLPTTVMLERVFEYEGYQVKSVYDGNSAIDAARTLLPDLILLDINMPGLNGFQVLQQLRERPATANIPTILITAMGDFTNVVQGLSLGADDYLRKPFHPQELLARAESKMKARRLEEALQQRTQELEALLRAGEELNRHLQIDELITIILYLTSDLIPCEISFIYYLNESGHIIDYDTHAKAEVPGCVPQPDQQLVDWIVGTGEPYIWSPDEPLIVDCPNGMVVPLLFGSEVRGMLGVIDATPYSDTNLRLFMGISRQAALALQNAELYDIKANYALHLEEQVAERTKKLESAQQMLIRSEKLASIGRLAAAVAHEINNPLFPIRLDLENMLEDVRAGTLVAPQEIEFMLENVDRIKYTVDRLLGFTGNKRADSADFKSIDINVVIRNIINLNEKLLKQADISVKMDLQELPPISGNSYQLEYVFMNLTLNARDAIGRRGEICFSSHHENGKIIIDVRDDGPGIAPDLIDNIFEPFVSTKEDGNGLGLYISYDIVQKHEGIINVKSTLGEGAHFTLVFPSLD
ncbi:MAG: response regulator [Chloroflexota bacterium]